MCFFFFKQKTAYEMRISDWSSDVCSSDLTFWFIGFELGSRAATPGKRLMGIRVVARDGGRLTADAVVARNLIRELELFLPLMMLGAGASEDKIGRAHV